MALDPFSVVLGFLAVVEVVLGVVAAVLGFRQRRAPVEGRAPLLAFVAAAAVAAAVLSFPLHYLLLESWVPRWPGIMCVEGVRRIGTGTVGAARFLPWIVQALDVTRLLVIFAAGAWLLLRRAPRAAIVLGALAALDGAAALAYVAIPKTEIAPVAGCCTVPASVADRMDGLTADGSGGGTGGVTATYLGVVAVLGAGSWILRGRTGAPRVALAVLAAGSLPLAARFLAEAVAPAVLALPYHRCAWCALARAPEAVAWAAIHGAAVLCAGWSLFAGDRARRLLSIAAVGFLVAGGLGALLPIAGPALRSAGTGRCAFDGVALDASHRVRVVDAAGEGRDLCCVDCARRWLGARRGERPRDLLVTDETSGAAVPAGKAWFVESAVLSFPVTGCRVHCFSLEADARRHAEQFRGIVLEGDRRPLRPWEGAER